MTELQRDRYGRPLVVPPAGGKPVAYTRCTTFVGAVEDTFNLSKWQQRQVMIGMVKRPDLAALVAGALHDRTALDKLREQAHDAAASDAAANMGTALHKMAEMLDTGLIGLDAVPADMRGDMQAYLAATAGWTHLHVETFMVRDDLKVGGTPDRISRLPDGRTVIADLKTGSIDYGIGKIASQLAMYSRSLIYDPATGMRHPIDVNQDVGVIIHLPAGSGECRLVDVDLNAGWDGVQLNAQVRAWRARKDLAWDHKVGAVVAPPEPEIRPSTADAILAEIQACDTVDALEGLYFERVALWGDRHTAAAAQRKEQIARGVA